MEATSGSFVESTGKAETFLLVKVRKVEEEIKWSL